LTQRDHAGKQPLLNYLKNISHKAVKTSPTTRKEPEIDVVQKVNFLSSNSAHYGNTAKYLKNQFNFFNFIGSNISKDANTAGMVVGRSPTCCMSIGYIMNDKPHLFSCCVRWKIIREIFAREIFDID
jgi:hypothetical protein